MDFSRVDLDDIKPVTLACRSAQALVEAVAAP